MMTNSVDCTKKGKQKKGKQKQPPSKCHQGACLGVHTLAVQKLMDCMLLVSSKKVPQPLKVRHRDGRPSCYQAALGVLQYYTAKHIQISRETYPEKIQGHTLCAGPAELIPYRLNCS